MKLSDKIVKLRKTNGLSQEDLAEKLNVSRQAISRWEGGSAQPDATNILQLSKLFGVTADYLLNDEYIRLRPMPTTTLSAAQRRHDDETIICFASLCCYFIPFNRKYRPEVLEKANLIQIRYPCCGAVFERTKERFDRENGKEYCHTCKDWVSAEVLSSTKGTGDRTVSL